jgi:Zn-dependent protease with chaperone function
MRRGLATLFTLSLLCSFLLAVVVGLMLFLGVFDLAVAVVLVLVINGLILLVGPWVNDRIYGWLYGVQWLSTAAFEERSPASVAVIEAVTEEYGYDTPTLGIIPDRNPTAFTYGSGRYNARIVVTEGCFEYLDDDELAAVMAHELGHVTSRDFIIMTLANTLVQLLYLIAVYSMRVAGSGDASGGPFSGPSSSRNGDPRAALAVVGVTAYVLWWLSEYAVLYLSRVREYAADAFAAEYGEADDLSMALVKIALGLVVSEDDPELLKATRNLGIMGLSQSKETGLRYHNAREYDRMDTLLEGLLFDLVSPWAHLLELNATHPLTGKRIRRLSEAAPTSRFDFDDVRERFPVDRARLYREFARDLAVLALPLALAIGFPVAYLGAVLVGAVQFSLVDGVGGWLVAIGLAQLVGAGYRYSLDEPEQSTVLDLLTDVYASPVDGATVELSGELVGRGTAGYRFSEDLLFHDETGLLYLKYDSWLPFIGDVLFAVREVPELIGEDVTIQGWYFRGTSTWLELRRLVVADRELRGFTHLGSYAGGAIAVVLGLVVLAVPFVL